MVYRLGGLICPLTYRACICERFTYLLYSTEVVNPGNIEFLDEHMKSPLSTNLASRTSLARPILLFPKK